MNYAKLPLTFEQQADQLIRRGMVGDRATLIERLQAVNYYRLSAYWFPFRQPDDSLTPGTLFETVWRRYVFDRHLRLLVMDAIERIEVTVRTQLAYHHAHRYGPFAYAIDPSALPKLKPDEHREFQEQLQKEIDRSRETFVDHFFGKYGDSHQHLPVWMAIELMTFGTLLTFFRNAAHQVKQAVASVFGMPATVFESWLLTLNTIRNGCAHHTRLWNRELGLGPIIPRISEYPAWHTPVKVENRRVFAVLTICRHCLTKTAPQSRWADRLRALLEEFREVPLAKMGFPANWQECPIWKA